MTEEMPTLPGLSDPLAEGEPVFPLRARDPLAPFLAALHAAVSKGDTASAVSIFSDMISDPGYNYRNKPRDPARVNSASAKAQEMNDWRKANNLEHFSLHTV